MKMPAGRALLLDPDFEWIRVAAIAPVLLFPLVRVHVTIAALAVFGVLACVSAATWRIRRPASPLAPWIWAVTFFVGCGTLVSPARDLSWPKAAGVLLGILSARAITAAPMTREAAERAFLACCAVGALWLAAGALGAAWLGKFAGISAVTSRLPRIALALPGVGAEGVHPNAIAGTTLFFIPGLLVLLHGGRVPPQWWKACVALLTFFAALLLLSQSRTAWAALAITLAIAVAVRVRRARVPLALATSIAAIVAAAAWPHLSHALRNVGAGVDPNEITVATRVDLWVSAAAALRDFPLTGIGLGTYRRIGPELYPVLRMAADFDVAHCHNVFLQTALDLGVPGLIAYIGLLACATRLCRTLVRSPRSAPIAWALALNILAVHAFGLADAIVLGAKVGLFLWIDLGLIGALAVANTASEAHAAA